MPFTTRCVECNAKLRFDEAPEPDEAIECPRCGHVFEGAEAKPVRKREAVAIGAPSDEPRRKRKKGEKPKTFKRKVRRAKKKKSNPVFLYGMIFIALVVVPMLGYVFYKLNYSTGKMGILMSYVPGDCNLLRGIDSERLSKVPGYADHLKVALEGPMTEIRDEFARATNRKPEEFYDYSLQAKVKDGGKSGTLFVCMALADFDSTQVAKSLGGTSQTIDGTECFRLPANAKGILANAMVYFPAPKQFVVVAAQGDQMRMLKESLKARGDPKNASLLPKLGATGMKVCRANTWTLMFAKGDLKGRIAEEIGDKIKSGYPALSDKLKKATMFGTYMYFGGMLKYGVAIDTESETAASDLAKTMREGPLGKGDDAEIANDLKLLFPPTRTKEFSEFMANLEFKSVKECAFLESRMTNEKSLIVISYFNRAAMWEGDPGESNRPRR